MNTGSVVSTPVGQDLQVAVVAWLEWLGRKPRTSAHTVNAYRRDLTAFLTYLSERQRSSLQLADLAVLSLADFQCYCDACLNRGQAPSSVARATSTLRNFFGFLDRRKLAHNDAIGQLPTPRVPKRKTSALSSDQAQQAVSVVSALSDAPWVAKRDEALFALLYGSGLRLGEALAMNYEQAPTSSSLTLTRGGKSRTVPVLPFVPIVFAEYLEACPYPFKQGQPLFVGAKGKRLNPGVVQRQMRRLRYVLHLPAETTPQTLRQCFARRLKAEGSDLTAIQKLLGHAYQTTTRRTAGG